MSDSMVTVGPLCSDPGVSNALTQDFGSTRLAAAVLLVGRQRV